METLDLANPFGGPVYHKPVVSSTMDEARLLAEGGAPHGTVISAGFQEKGRGSRNRNWQADRGNLFFTLLLRFPGLEALPPGITLRAGLAVSLAAEDMARSLDRAFEGPVLVKWPNDVMIPINGNYRKSAGILVEGKGNTVFAGIGVNVAQEEFPGEIRNRAGSLRLALGPLPLDASFSMLEKTLDRLYGELRETAGDPWRFRLDERLYRKGETVRFITGSGENVTGILAGTGPGGELILDTDREKRTFVSGELKTLYPSREFAAPRA
jgi:BirA family biotin operon repressor/biotin-[acetyl-CoA-carboxylase] ligase